MRGRDSVGSWVKEGFFDPFEVNFDARLDRIVVAGSEAFAPGTFTLDLQPRSGGEAINTTGAFFNVFREESPGSWKYAYAIFNFGKPLE